MMSLQAGNEYSSFIEWQEHLKEYCQEKAVSTYIWDSKTIKYAKERGIKKIKNDELVYYYIKYGCARGGKKFVARGQGKRDTRTLKDGCQFKLSLRVNEDGDKLQITSLEENHNHEINRELFRHLPKQRQLTTEERSVASSFLDLGANKKLLQEKMMRETNKVIILKDLANIEQHTKNTGSKNDLESMVNKLRSVYRCEVKLVGDSDSNFLGLFFQDSEMKAVFASYPEITCLDATYKLTKLRFPFYIFLVEDGLGLSEICGAALLANDEESTLRWLLSAFKEANPKSADIKGFMTDKDVNERHLIKELFENAALLLCLFHTLRNFKRECSVQKMGITQGQVETLAEIFQNMAYAKNLTEYERHKSNFLSVAPIQVREYFLLNWDPIRDEWVHSEKSKQGNLLNSTNNRLESINGKLKSVIKKFSTLDVFVDRFFTILTSLRVERDSIASHILNTRKVQPYMSSAVTKYARVITPYALSYLEQQYKLFTSHLQREVTNVDGESFQIPSSEGDLICTPENCSCLFRSSMQLPCRHIFLVRHLLQRDEFDVQLCCERWRLSHFKRNVRVLNRDMSIDAGSENCPSTDIVRRVTGSTVQKRFRQAKVLTDQIADVISESTGAVFESRMEFLRNIYSTLVSSTSETMTVRISSESSDQASDPSTSNDIESTVAPVAAPDSPLPILTANTVPVPSTVEADYPPPSSSSTNNSVVISTPLAQHSCSSPLLTSSTSTSKTTVSLKLPSTRAPKGRPKGVEKTVVGTNRKRKKKDTNRMQPFCKLHVSEKKKEIQSWFVGKARAIDTVNEKKRITKEDLIDFDSQKLLLCAHEEMVDVQIIRPFTEPCAYQVIMQQVANHTNKELLCETCRHPIEAEVVQKCAACLSSYHLPCIDRLLKSKVRHWFCKACASVKKSKMDKSETLMQESTISSLVPPSIDLTKKSMEEMGSASHSGFASDKYV